MDAREVALLTLNTCQRQGGWSDGVLKKQLAAILKEYEISDSDIKEYFSGAETVAENDLIRAVANEEEYRIYIKKQNQQ